MTRRLLLGLLALPVAALVGTAKCNPPPGQISQVMVNQPGYVEIHTPGSGALEEIAPTAALTALLGPGIDLNTITTARSRFDNGSGDPPSAVIVLIPGFLGGATTFDPLARDLVRKFNGTLEVWAVDRRPNQLEDRLGAEFAIADTMSPSCVASPHHTQRPLQALADLVEHVVFRRRLPGQTDFRSWPSFRFLVSR